MNLGSNIMSHLQTNSDNNDSIQDLDSPSNQNKIKKNRLFYSDNIESLIRGNQKKITTEKFYVKQTYPIDFSQSNPFCPFCGKFVAKQTQFYVHQNPQRRKKYLIHTLCSEKNSDSELQITKSPQAKLQSIAFINHVRSIALGGKQYYVQMEVIHPLGGYSFLKLWTKLKSIGSIISWDLRNMQQSDCFSPNIIAFPIPEFEINLSLNQIGQKQSLINKRLVFSVGRLGGNDVQFVKASNQDLQLTMKVIGNKQQQEKIIDQMNIKYRYSLNLPTPLIQLVRLQIKMPSIDSDDSDNEEGGFRAMQALNQKVNIFKQDKSAHNSQALSQRSFDKEKVDLQKLIITGKLSEYVRQNTQSRVFQGWLGEANSHQIDEIINYLYPQIPQLITHEYANYMVQKLLGVCTLPQRIKIVQRLQEDIPSIVRNKQGTHSLQTLIALFTSDQQYKIVCDSIKSSYLTLSQHPNATHFLQKIICLFPLSHTIDFITIVNSDFLNFAIDKNAMCVIKQMIKRINELQQNNKELQLTQAARKQFIHSANFNIDRIIGDPYGNYVIQFCYELFGEVKCVAITERIIQKFSQFSLQKYSSAVIFKCVNSYWTKKQSFEKLKNSLKSDNILEMFRNKQANKILLEIMQRHEDSFLRQKIQNHLMIGQLTKFNHQRWGAALGSRSGVVGSQFSSFSEAVKTSTKKKKRFNNQH